MDEHQAVELVDAVKRDRAAFASALCENAETIGRYAKDGESAVMLAALLIELAPITVVPA